jgi:O-antigen ligase
MTLMIVAILAAAFLYTALRDMRWAVFVIAALLPTYLLRFTIGPFPSTLLEVLILITIIVWGVKHRGFRLQDARTQPWAMPMVLLLFAGGAGVVMAPDPIAALGLFRAYLLELATIRSKADLRALLTAFGISALILSLYALFQRFTGLGIPTPWDTELRVTSFYPFPNAVGLFFAPLIPIFLMLTAQKQKWGWRLFWVVTALASLLAVFFSQTEGAWVGILVGLFVVGITAPKAKIATAIVGVVIVLLVAGVPSIREPVVEKLTLKDWSGQVRRTQWIETAHMLQDRSFFGAGLAGYPETMTAYHKADYIEIFQYPHNILFNFWSELGILGLLALGWILLVFWILLRFAHPDHRWLVRGITAGLVALVVHGLVDVPYFKNDLAIQFWMLAAIATYIAFPDQQKPREEAPNAYLSPALPQRQTQPVQKPTPSVE